MRRHHAISILSEYISINMLTTRLASPPTGSFDCIGAILPTKTIFMDQLNSSTSKPQISRLLRLMMLICFVYIYWQPIYVFFSVSPCIICEFIDVNGFLQGINFESLQDGKNLATIQFHVEPAMSCQSYRLAILLNHLFNIFQRLIII